MDFCKYQPFLGLKILNIKIEIISLLPTLLSGDILSYHNKRGKKLHNNDLHNTFFPRKKRLGITNFKDLV